MDQGGIGRRTLVKVKIYLEGGGDSKSLHSICRKGFCKLFERAGFAGRMPRLVACGSRNSAFSDFAIALESANADYHPILLVDSESDLEGRSPWEHLQFRDNWKKPQGVDDSQALLMVQCMESWIISDRKSLRAFFGQCLNESSLLPPDKLESRSKDDVQTSLEAATKTCGDTRAYTKGRKSFEVLGELDPTVMRSRLPSFDRLWKVLDSKL